VILESGDLDNEGDPNAAEDDLMLGEPRSKGKSMTILALLGIGSEFVKPKVYSVVTAISLERRLRDSAVKGAAVVVLNSKPVVFC